MSIKGRDLIDLKFERLTVIKLSPKTYRVGYKFWTCFCDCGKAVDVSQSHLVTGHTKSCGCMKSEIHSKRLTTHGKSEHKLYRLYNSILERCYSQYSKSYIEYGGRGIKVCDRWRNSFLHFLDDIGEKPEGKYSLDRIDNNGDYEPDNVRWATDEQQSNNRRNIIFLTYKDETKPLSQWAKDIGLKRKTLACRIKRGWTIEEILETPVLTNKMKWQFKREKLMDETKDMLMRDI